MLFPLPFFALSRIDNPHGLLWIFFHNLYYQPFAGILDEPFFTRDSDIGFIVNIPGRIISPIGYIITFLIYKTVRHNSP
jgi:hypothetical protein